MSARHRNPPARPLTDRQRLALGYLDASDRITAEDLPMALKPARAVLRDLARTGYAAEDGPGTFKYLITAAGRSALAASREEARRDAGLS